MNDNQRLIALKHQETLVCRIIDRIYNEKDNREEIEYLFWNLSEIRRQIAELSARVEAPFWKKLF